MCTLARLNLPGFFMLSRSQIQFINSLHQKKFRKEHQCFTASGSKLVEELLHSRLDINAIYATQTWIKKNQSQIEKRKVEVKVISEKELSRISPLKTPNQAIAVLPIASTSYNPQLASKEFILMLDDISDPGNFGTILRTADWFGIHHVICSPNTVDLYNPKTIQATMGSIARVNVYYMDLEEILASRMPDTPVYGSLLSGKTPSEIEFKENGILIIGNEAHGLSSSLMPYISQPVFIPSYFIDGPGKHRPESLNAAVAAAILCWEIRRKK